MRQSSTSLSRIIERNGATWHVRVVGRQREDGTWEGRVEFRNGISPPLFTDEETSQPNLQDLEYWATGLEQVFLEGALDRAFAASAKRKGA
ncbi:MAG TPA: hypothetical protein VKH35_04655 [Thermoanaerobaculia bacterium]|nr:hypothetical protein [Thermoanaerobaculia bacterium]